MHILENLDKKIDSYIEKFENEIRKLNLDSQTNNLEMSINQCFQTGMLFILDESYSSLRKRLDELFLFDANQLKIEINEEKILNIPKSLSEIFKDEEIESKLTVSGKFGIIQTVQNNCLLSIKNSKVEKYIEGPEGRFFLLISLDNFIEESLLLNGNKIFTIDPIEKKVYLTDLESNLKFSKFKEYSITDFPEESIDGNDLIKKTLDDNKIILRKSDNELEIITLDNTKNEAEKSEILNFGGKIVDFCPLDGNNLVVLADDKIVFYEDFITEKYQLTIENIKKVKTDSLVVSPNFSFIIVNMKSRSRRRDQEKYEGSIMFILNKENGKYYQKGMTKKSKKKFIK